MIQVLQGGVKSYDDTRYKFIAGEISNTRLMGVVAMHIAFIDTIDVEAVHTFFYFDYEEFGIDHIKLLRSSDSKQIAEALTEAFSGLGAELKELSEEEAKYLVQNMADETRKKGQPLPLEFEEVSFMLNEKIQLSAAKKNALLAKMCVPIKSDYGVVNYYLMRSFGKDLGGAALLVDKAASSSEDRPIKEIAPASHSTFLRNKIELQSGAEGMHKTYRCESVIDVDKENRHHFIVSEIEVYKRKVTAARKISDMPISLYEVGLLLNRQEYVTVYEIKEDADIEEFVDCWADFTLAMNRHAHTAGDMFIDYKKDNNHAENKEFRLNDDIDAVFFLSESGQILIASYSITGIINSEARMALDPVGAQLVATNRYTFAASIIYDYAESGFSDFNEFLQTIE